MKITHMSLSICSMLATVPAISAFSITDWYHSLVGTNYHHKTLHHEYTVTNQEKLRVLNNGCGSISVKTNWNHKKILLTASIQGTNSESINGVSITEKQIPGILELATVAQDANVIVDCELIVPSDVSLEIVTHEGNIDVKQITKPTVLSTDTGSISIYKAQQPVTVSILTKGSIEIEHAHSTVKATTKEGDIRIHDTHSSVIAHTNYGSITHHSCNVPSTAKIELMADHGTITTQLPSDVNAEVQAHTKKGTITCEHAFTMHSFTSPITKNTFDRFKKEIEGTLGSGEAQIFLSSLKGNIAIKEVKA